MDLASDDLAVEDRYPAQPLITHVFAKQRALQFRPKPPPKPKARHGPLPTVADLAVGPSPLKTSPRPAVKYPAPQCTAQALAAPPPAKKSRISPELQCGGLPPPPAPPLPRSISGTSGGSSSTSPAAQPRPLPSAQAALVAPKPRRVKVSSVRKSLATRVQTCGTVWLQLVYKLASASTLLASVSTTAHASEHLLAVIRSNAPVTLERYLRIASLFISFLESSATSFLEVSLASVLDFLAIARASHSQDREVHRISAESSIKALRWFVRQAQWDCLSNALNSPVIRAYSMRGTAQDRREALPIPWALITGWEERVCEPGTPPTTKAVLGAALLATHASLRFGDLQRVDFSSLSLSTSALHGTCFATKTTTHGQPFAVTLAGITGRNLTSCWTLHGLAALHSLVSPYLQQEDAPDFLWLSTALDAQALDELAPASALLCRRYAATLPWRVAGNGLLPGEARQLTLHSMKSTLLAAAAQLRLAKEIRLAQGHHRDSARLYSRNDTFDSLDAQHRSNEHRLEAKPQCRQGRPGTYT